MTITKRPPWWEDKEWDEQFASAPERKAEDQPRQPAGSSEGGQFASSEGGGGGGDSATSESAARATAREAVSRVPKTPGRVDGSGTREDPIAVGNDLDRAVREIYAGNHIRLDQPTEVSTLIDKLGDYAEDAVAKGENAPEYDLGKVSVAGTNLFTQESLGIPRVHMPQLAGVPLAGSPADGFPKDAKGSVNLGEQFRDAMEDDGYRVSDERVSAETLRATQMDLKGPQVAGMSRSLEEGRLNIRPIFVSKDNYIVDGHHQWAATVLANLRAGEEKFDIPVQRVDTDIGTVLDAANEFTEAMGIPPRPGVAKTIEAIKRLMAWMDEAEQKYNPPPAPEPDAFQPPDNPKEGLKTYWQRHLEQQVLDARLAERVQRYRSLFDS